MNSFVIILSCLSAIALANPGEILEYWNNGQRTCRTNCRSVNPLTECPPSNCPPPVRDGNCGVPDCNIPGNRVVHHPHPDPNYYYHCAQSDALGNWAAIRMPCACKTIFYSPANRCVHREEWRRECPSQPDNPIFRECTIDCPSCNGPITPTPGPITPTPGPITPTPGPITPSPTPPPTALPPVSTDAPGNGNCPCVCVCIWWPCQPCASNCACNQQNQQQRPQNPWQQQPQQPWQREQNW